MKEIISFHIGQAGVQCGLAFWELFCAEHNLQCDGHLQNESPECENMETFFHKSCFNNWVPRSLFIDLEPNVVDEIRSGAFRKLFHPDRLLNGLEDASNNFSRGFFTVGKLLLSSINLEMRHMIEQCDMVQGMIILRSLGGGTGAGLTSAMFESLSDYPKTPKIEMPIYPSPTLSSSMVEPYNCLLGEHFCMEDIDVGLLFDNEAMFDLCSRYVNVNYPTYSTINRLIAQVASSITASVRFENVLNCDLTVLQTNMVPYPRIHFPLCNFAPILSQDRVAHQKLTVQELTRMVFDRENQMMKIDHFYGKFMSCALFYRGNVCPHHVYLALSEIKRDKSIEFVDWCPTGFKIGINAVRPVTVPESLFAEATRNVAMLTNTSAIGQAWQRLTHRFYLLYSKRSFVHWFVGEGMEECEFTEALYNISALVKDYEEAGENTMDSHQPESGNDPEESGTKDTVSSKDKQTAVNENVNTIPSELSEEETEPSEESVQSDVNDESEGSDSSSKNHNNQNLLNEQKDDNCNYLEEIENQFNKHLETNSDFRLNDIHSNISLDYGNTVRTRIVTGQMIDHESNVNGSLCNGFSICSNDLVTNSSYDGKIKSGSLKTTNTQIDSEEIVLIKVAENSMIHTMDRTYNNYLSHDLTDNSKQRKTMATNNLSISKSDRTYNLSMKTRDEDNRNSSNIEYLDNNYKMISDRSSKLSTVNLTENPTSKLSSQNDLSILDGESSMIDNNNNNTKTIQLKINDYDKETNQTNESTAHNIMENKPIKIFTNKVSLEIKRRPISSTNTTNNVRTHYVYCIRNRKIACSSTNITLKASNPSHKIS